VSTVDFMSEEGAAELKRRLEQSWQRKLDGAVGGPVFYIIPDGASNGPNKERRVWCVRSNLVRGLPPMIGEVR
jgi:hypothetical protein